MSIQKRSKLNLLQKLLPHKGIVTAHYLKENGISQELIQRYVKSGWLERFGFGAFKRPDDEITWESALSAIQTQLGIPVHIGAKTALELKGKSHYVRLGEGGVLFFFGLRGEKKLPQWFLRGPWKHFFRVTYNELFPNNNEHSLSQIEIESGRLIVSSPERAALEMLYLLPSQQSWDEANLIFENFTSLRSKNVQSLLENCNSIKTKRLFLYFSEKHNHSWFKKLNLSKIDLGSGKREIAKKGRFDKKYLITIPELLFKDQSYEKQL